MKLFSENWFFDIETYKVQANSEVFNVPYIIGLCNQYGDFYHFYHVEGFIQFLLDYVEEHQQNIYLYAYNTAYDLTTIHPLIDNQTVITRGFLSEDNEFLEYYAHRKKQRNKIYFGDLWRFNKSMGLRHWYNEVDPEGYKGVIFYDKHDVVIKGDYLYYKDGEGNQHTTPLSDEIDYLKRDVLILPKILEYINDFKNNLSGFMQEHFKLENPIELANSATISGIAKRCVSDTLKQLYGYNFDQLFRQSLISKDFNYKDEGVYTVLNCSKMGGFTSYNRDVLKFKDVDYTYYDVNSLYPSIMVKPLPVGKLYKSYKECVKGYYKDYNRLRFTPEIKTIYKITYTKTAWKDDYKHIGKGAFKSRTPYQQLYIYKDLLDTYKQILDFENLEILETYYIAHIPVLNDVISELYQLKSTQAKDSVGYQASKLILNSLYGKTNEEEHLDRWKLHNGTVEPDFKDNIKFLSLFAGIWICSQAHMLIIDLIIKSKQNNIPWFYCDTDSFILPTSANIITNVDQSKLGYFKVEGIYNEGYNPNLSKKYWMKNEHEIKLATSGISKTYIEVLPENLQKQFFQKEYNFLMVNTKKVGFTNVMRQKLIYNTDFESNNRIPITHKVYFKEELQGNQIIKTVERVEHVES